MGINGTFMRFNRAGNLHLRFRNGSHGKKLYHVWREKISHPAFNTNRSRDGSNSQLRYNHFYIGRQRFENLWELIFTITIGETDESDIDDIHVLQGSPENQTWKKFPKSLPNKMRLFSALSVIPLPNQPPLKQGLG